MPRGLAAAALAAVLGTWAAACTQSGSTGSSSPTAATPVVKSATVAASPASGPGASPSAASPLQIVEVQLSPADGTIRLQNLASSGAGDIELRGWTLQVGSTSVTLPANARIRPGETLVIHTGPAPGASPAPATPTPNPGATQTQVSEISLGDQGNQLRAALQPGTQVVLVDDRQRNVSQFTVAR